MYKNYKKARNLS